MANVSEIEEVMIALIFTLKLHQPMISRLSIEEEILKHPGMYPKLHDKPVRSLRRIITMSMDLVFTIQYEGKYRHKWVWDISHKIPRIRGES